jgi:hypothetical protein
MSTESRAARPRRLSRLLAALVAHAALVPISSAIAEPGAASAAAAPDPYAALEPLIGEWDVSPANGPPAFIERFSWGPGRSYVWVSVALLRGAEPEHLHFEGLVIWIAATRRFDYLFAVEPGSLTQERGEIRVESDGTIVRDVILTAGNGGTANFRQTFRGLGDGRLDTALMRQTPNGWQPTFPGSEKLTMVRRQ